MGAGRSKGTPASSRPESKEGVRVRVGTGSVAPSPALGPYVSTLDSLEEIADWLGTFREGLGQARNGEAIGVTAIVEQLEARYQVRRAELS